MVKDSGKSKIVCIDRYIMKEIKRWETVTKASIELGIPKSSIYGAIIDRRPIFDCYWVYERELDKFKPNYTLYIKVHHKRQSKRLEELRTELYKNT